MEQVERATWRTSSYSGGNGGNCVEVGQGNGVLVRDTKDRDSAVLAFGADAWEKFTAALRLYARS
jgi:hypothetical protein